jgi:hypothetical protein
MHSEISQPLETAAQHEIWMKPMRPVELLAAIRITAAVGP